MRWVFCHYSINYGGKMFDKKTQFEVVDLKELGVDLQNNQSQLNAANKWFIENNILNDHVKNNLILFASCYHNSIQDVEIFVNASKKTMLFVLYMSRWNLLFKSRRVCSGLRNALLDYLINYDIKICCKIYGKNKTSI